jgi:hypothetical protein
MAKAETVTKPPKAAKAAETVEQAEQRLRQAHEKREAVDKQLAEVNVERERIGYDALLADDEDALAQLKALNDQATALEGNKIALAGAFAEAQRRLAAAQQRASIGDRKAKARAAKKKLAEAIALAPEIDEAFEAAFGKLVRVEGLMREVYHLGCQRPSPNLIENGLQRCVRTVVTTRGKYLPDCSPLPRNERRTVAELLEVWRTGITHWAEQQLAGDDDGDSSEGKK